MRDRLTELVRDASAKWYREAVEGTTEKTSSAYIADHLLANGVIVPPVNIGQTVWFFSGVLEEVCESKVVRIDMNFFTNPSLWMELEYHSNLIGTHVIRGQIDSLFGKTVFLTKEEAEAELSKRSKEE